jgi:broad specificity phosphatase PhoE
MWTISPAPNLITGRPYRVSTWHHRRVTDLRELVVARHGQSTANAAWPYHGEVVVEGRDRDVPLTDLGRRQSVALGGWLSGRPAPEVVVCSTFRRARDTWAIAAAGLAMPAAVYDERLIDRGMGELELLTPSAIDRRYPAEMTGRIISGEYEYRPPGGETLLDVAGRVAEVVTELRRDHSGKSVFVIAHDAVVLMFRYVIDGLTLDQLSEVARAGVANASVTRFDGTGGTLRFASYETT